MYSFIKYHNYLINKKYLSSFSFNVSFIDNCFSTIYDIKYYKIKNKKPIMEVKEFIFSVDFSNKISKKYFNIIKPVFL